MTKTISFVIPVYNEKNRIESTFTALKNAAIPELLKLEKIIFVNDGSTDNTLSILNSQKDEISKATGAEVVVLNYSKNRGKGYAVKTGMNYSNSDYTLFFDADISTPLNELKKFIPFIERGEDVIVGTRKNGESTVIVHQPRFREIMGKAYTFLSQLILDTWVTDFTCGFKAFSRRAKNEIFTRSVVDRWSYDSEILFIAKRLGYKLVEKAVLWSDDKDTRVNLFRAVFTSFADLLKIRINHLFGVYTFSKRPVYLTRIQVAGN